jgi:D-serine deaminase-like pyridoxal phosphate-dependent protein
VKELDTPSLVVDISALEHNLEAVHGFFRDIPVKMRPHVHAHKTPTIAHMQLSVPGNAGGIAVINVSEAELFAQHGFTDITLSSPVVSPSKLRRLCALTRTVKLNLPVDSSPGADILSEAAQANGVAFDVLVDINTYPPRGGTEAGAPSVALARQIAAAPGLRFAGFTTVGGPISEGSPEEMLVRDRANVQKMLDTREMAEREGLEVEVVSAGNHTHDAHMVATMSGVTEVRSGAYPLIDHRHWPHCPDLTPGARVLSTVTSRPEAGRAIVNAGQKAISCDMGMPKVDGRTDATVAGLNAEHGILDLEGDARKDFQVGDRVWLLIADLNTSTALHDYIFAARNGVLEAVWEVSARGLYD